LSFLVFTNVVQIFVFLRNFYLSFDNQKKKKKVSRFFGFGFEPNFCSKKMSREAWGANKTTKTRPTCLGDWLF